jgi:uncharacterized membrane protein YsdA (DUF1294 family)
METLLTYFGIITVVTIVVAIFDKKLAAKRKLRVPEKWLLALSWLGGAPGAKIAQVFFGHRPLKLGFTTNLNLILILQIAIILAAWSGQVTMKMQDDNIAAMQKWMGKSEKPEGPKRFGPGSKS